MDLFETHEVVFNLALFKKLRFYHIFDPYSATIYNYNIYRLVCIALIIFVIPINFYGLFGFIIKMEDAINEIDLIRILYIHMHSFLSIIKISVCIYNADKVWDLLDVTRVNFLKSAQCPKRIEILYKYQETSIKITNFLYEFLKITLLVWVLFPLALNIMKTADNRGKQRYESILNFRFPLKIHLYNSYFFFIYIFEIEALFVVSYSWLIVNILLISMFYVFTAQYEIYARAFEMIGHVEELQCGKYVIIRNKCHHNHMISFCL